MHASRYVDVFGIHKEALVEGADFAQCVCPEQEEAPQKVGAVEGFVMVGVGKEVALHASACERGRQKAFGKDIPRRREHAACVL